MPEAVIGHPFLLAAEPKGDKLRRWQSAIWQTFGAIDMRIRDDLHFSGAIRRISLSPLELTDVRSSSECARRTRRHLDHDLQDVVALLLIREGNIELDQHGRHNVIREGTFTLLDLNEPYDWMHAHTAHVIGIKLLKRTLAERVGDLMWHVGRMRGTAVGIGRLMADYLESFSCQAASIPETAGRTFEQQFLDLAELLLTGKDDETSLPKTAPAEAIHRRALAFMDRRLADPDLSPDEIAQAMPVSLRYLHAIFHSFGTSVCETLLDRRLALCHTRLVTDPRLAISDVAYRTGFRSHAHFSTAFKKKYGLSPRDVQRLGSSTLPSK